VHTDIAGLYVKQIAFFSWRFYVTSIYIMHTVGTYHCCDRPTLLRWSYGKRM